MGSSQNKMIQYFFFLKINVDFSNNIEAMFERSHVKVKVEPR